MSAATAVLGMAIVSTDGVASDSPALAVAPLLAGRGTDALDRESLLFASAGIAAAIQSAIQGSDAALAGVVCGTRSSGEANYLRILRAIRTGATIRPSWGPRASFNAPAAELSIRLGATGPCLTVTSGDAAGLEAVLLGCDLVARGQAPAVLAGGVAAASGPCERAAVLVLARRQQRGDGTVLAYLEGKAIVFTPAVRAAELRQVTCRAVRNALQDAERKASEIDIVVLDAPTSCSSVDHELEAGLDDVIGLGTARMAVDNVRGLLGGVGITLAAVSAVRQQVRCALVVALERDGRALALVVTRPESEGE